jgi:hypothetical protein
MTERLSLNNSWRAGERMAELCETGHAWQNHSGSFRGEPWNRSYVDTGQMPDAQAKIIREFAHAGELDYVVWSYSTPIAYRAGGQWYIPTTKYSVTTSKHQGKLYRLGRQTTTV